MKAKETGDGPVVLTVIEASWMWRKTTAPVTAPPWLNELLIAARGLKLHAGAIGLTLPVCERFAASRRQ
jgi:hypothetical protein